MLCAVCAVLHTNTGVTLRLPQVLMGLVWRIQISKQRDAIHAVEMVKASSTSMKLRVDFDDGDTALTPRVYKILFCRTGKNLADESYEESAILKVPLCARTDDTHRKPTQRIVEADTMGTSKSHYSYSSTPTGEYQLVHSFSVPPHIYTGK